MEAVLHYTHAIKLDPKNYSLYSNRSLAFLKSQQYFYALEDAKETIKLKPDWAKVCLVFNALLVIILIIRFKHSKLRQNIFVE